MKIKTYNKALQRNLPLANPLSLGVMCLAVSAEAESFEAVNAYPGVPSSKMGLGEIRITTVSTLFPKTSQSVFGAFFCPES
jgi:hypothetical protein